MPAIVLAGGYLYWRLLRHAVLFEYGTRPSVKAHILEPSQRYETYVSLGELGAAPLPSRGREPIEF